MIELKITNVTLLKVSVEKNETDCCKNIYKLKFLSSINHTVKNITARMVWKTKLLMDDNFNGIYQGSLGDLENKIKELFPGIRIGDQLE